MIRARSAWAELTDDDNMGPIVVGGLICAAIGCEENPIDSQAEAERRLSEEIRLANEAVNSTFRDVQRVAVRYGANPTVDASATAAGNTSGM